MTKPPKPLDCGTPRHHSTLTILQNDNEKAMNWKRPSYRKQDLTWTSTGQMAMNNSTRSPKVDEKPLFVKGPNYRKQRGIWTTTGPNPTASFRLVVIVEGIARDRSCHVCPWLTKPMTSLQWHRNVFSLQTTMAKIIAKSGSQEIGLWGTSAMTETPLKCRTNGHFYTF